MEKPNKFFIVIGVVIALLLVAGVVVSIQQGTFAKTISSKKAGDIAMNYINNNLLAGSDQKAELVKVSDGGTVYKITIKVGEAQYDSYISKDGKLLFPEGFEIAASSTPDQSPSQNQNAQVPKKDKPDVKLFVMSYCPYGLQMQKALLPVYNLLKDKADIGVYFVNYLMHGKKELTENLTQYCIQKEEKSKYSAYLDCFVKSGDSAKCIVQAGVTKSKIDSCSAATDKQYNLTALSNDTSSTYPKFPLQDDLNKKYGIQGSPTLVINDVVADGVDRSPEKVKEAICNAFTTAPAECSQKLSETQTTPGIGESAANSDNSASCQ